MSLDKGLQPQPIIKEKKSLRVIQPAIEPVGLGAPCDILGFCAYVDCQLVMNTFTGEQADAYVRDVCQYNPLKCELNYRMRRD